MGQNNGISAPYLKKDLNFVAIIYSNSYSKPVKNTLKPQSSLFIFIIHYKENGGHPFELHSQMELEWLL